MQEKRRDEEMHHMIKEWSTAKERISVELTRKGENRTEATKFEKARGFVRSNYSSKGYNYNL